MSRQRLPLFLAFALQGWPALAAAGDAAQSTASPAELASGKRVIEVNADEAVGECYNFWSIQNYTSQDMFADPAQRQTVARKGPFTKYINCIRLIGGRADGKNEWFQGVGADGKIRCDFGPMLQYFHGIRDWGYTPRIVLDNVPMAMSEPVKKTKYGNSDPPKDYNVYHAYIEALTRALADEFGADAAGRWRFRVMTEPDNPTHWTGTKEEYFKLYDYAVDAVTRVIPDADIGPGNIINPAKETDLEKWGLEIVDHCATGRNYCTGATGTRLRYFSCSWYGNVKRGNDDFDTVIRLMRERLDRYPQFRGLPVEVGEFSLYVGVTPPRPSLGSEASEWGGSFMASVAESAWRLNVAQVHQWIGEWSAKPFTHVRSMLARMEGGRRLAVATTPAVKTGSESADCSAIGCSKDGRLLLMLYHHRPTREPAPDERVTLRVLDKRMAAGAQWTMTQWRVDAEHGTSIHAIYEDCEAAGLKPLPNTRRYCSDVRDQFGPGIEPLLEKNREKYAKLAALTPVVENAPLKTGEGKAELQLVMPSHSVWLIEMKPGA